MKRFRMVDPKSICDYVPPLIKDKGFITSDSHFVTSYKTSTYL